MNESESQGNSSNSVSSSPTTGSSNSSNTEKSTFVKPTSNQLVKDLIQQVNQTPKRNLPDTPASKLAKDISNCGLVTPASKSSQIIGKSSTETPKKPTSIDISSSDTLKENNQAGCSNPSSKKVSALSSISPISEILKNTSDPAFVCSIHKHSGIFNNIIGKYCSMAQKLRCDFDKFGCYVCPLCKEEVQYYQNGDTIPILVTTSTLAKTH